jgi:hypothetical protein
MRLIEDVVALILLAFGLVMFFLTGGNCTWINPGE